ncbi:MAG TPA: 50S ribosomal protein L18 [Euryarchaeota archaeon]|nr:50S ribosomal protein L18 [Euryarchaeota archaeon]
MSTGPRYKVPFRRRRTGQTNYRYRKKLLMGGKPRLVVRRSLKCVTIQIVTYQAEGDRVVATANTRELKKFGWSGAKRNLPSAYLAGYMAAKRGLKEGYNEVVLDIGLRKPVPGSISFAAMKGAVDAGMNIPHGESIVPTDERLSGVHMKEGTPEMFNKVKAAIEEAEL